MKPLTLQDEKDILDILEEQYKESDDMLEQEAIIREISHLCYDIIKKGGDIII